MQLDGTKLVNARLDKGWTQDQVAKAAGIALKTYNSAEHSGSIHPSTAVAIADALGLELSSIRVRIEIPTEEQTA